MTLWLFETCLIYQKIDEFTSKYISRINHYIHWLLLFEWSCNIFGIFLELFYIYTVQLHKTICLKLTCRNSSMKSNGYTIALCLAESAKKYFIVLIDDVVSQVSTIISLFWKSPLTTILIFTFSILPLDWIFAFYTSTHGVTWSSLFGSSIRKVRFSIDVLMSFKVTSN